MQADATATLWDRLARLPLDVDRVDFERHAVNVGGALASRVTTSVILRGGGHVGRGEDVTYTPAEHDWYSAPTPMPDLSTCRTLKQVSELLERRPLFADGTWEGEQRSFRRWAWESAAMDLALRQGGTRLSDLVGRTLRPVRFCVSMGLGSPPEVERVLRWLAVHPQLEFKLDASLEWDDELMARLADTGAVRVVDIKGHYTGDWIDNRPDADLYGAVARLLPDVLIEDPMITPQTRPALGEDGLARTTWDAPIHSVADLEQLTDPPAAINIKPTRFGTVAAVLEAIEWCLDRGLPMYGGGQYELAHGRSQIQHLAALWYPETANDVAPVAWHGASPGDPVPLSPFELADEPGFGLQAANT